MINQLNNDRTPLLPFANGELDRSGLRLTRAEFGRFIGVSKQAVGEWCKAGKITLGADGRVDPRVAVSQLLRNTDPARLRSKVLAPLVASIGTLQKRIADLEIELANADENADFQEASALEFLEQQTALRQLLHDEAVELAKQPCDRVIAGVIAWLDKIDSGEVVSSDIPKISDCLPVAAKIVENPSSGALDVEKGEGG